jgi:hypothetical protein
MNSRWVGLSFGAMLLSLNFCDNEESWGIRMDDQYAWGSECADGLAIGLLIEGREFRLNTTIRWQWAIRNNRDTVREVIVSQNNDPAFRYRLLVSRQKGHEPLWEFTPPVVQQTMNTLGKKIFVLKDHPVELEGGKASIDSSWGAGSYNLQLVFGGPAFNFECRSAVISVLTR